MLDNSDRESFLDVSKGELYGYITSICPCCLIPSPFENSFNDITDLHSLQQKKIYAWTQDEYSKVHSEKFNMNKDVDSFLNEKVSNLLLT